MVPTESNISPIFLRKGAFLPQEEMLEVKKPKKRLKIGIPKENQRQENRVTLTPEAVENLIEKGHEVLIEKGAGKQASYSDKNYVDRGGLILSDRKEIFHCDIILKVAPLTPGEIDLLKGDQIVISSLHFNADLGNYINKLLKKKITAIAFENLKDDGDYYPIDRSMSEISGATAIFIAAEYLSNIHRGKGVFLGGITGITPCEVVVLGAGTAAEYAARAALGLGALVKVFDNSNVKLRRLQNNLGQRLYTSVFHNRVIEKALVSADVVIGAIHLTRRGPRYFITEDMVRKMKSGSVIVDISIDQGGCIETSECRTHENPVFKKHGVIHYCIPNIPSRVARTASIALSNIFAPLLISLGELGGLKNLLKEDLGVRHGVYAYNGILTNSHIGDILGLPSKDIELLMAAF